MDDKLNILYKKINSKDIIIFGLSYCGYSAKTVEYLKQKNIKFKYYIVDKYYDIFIKLLHELSKIYLNLNINIHHKTFPVIFIKNKFIGGYNELINLL